MQFLGFFDLILASFIIGANVWFFFLQSPALIGFLGRDKFVPIQMRLTKLLFRAVSIAAILLIVVAWFANMNTLSMLGADLTLAAALVANFFVIPRALVAGGKAGSRPRRLVAITRPRSSPAKARDPQPVFGIGWSSCL